jgi:hypothetical protein
MIDLLNKLLARFGFQLVSTKPDTTLVKETLGFLNTIPKGALKDDNFASLSGYVGDINYVKEKVEGEFPQVSGRTYFQHQVLGKDRTYFNFDGEKYTTQELAEKLNNE